LTSERVEPSSATDRSLRAAQIAVEQRAVGALSLDVFDTMLLRRVPRPTDAFLLLGSRLVGEGALRPFVTPALFAAVRESAERRARARKRHLGEFPEVRLLEIYAELPDSVLAIDRDGLADAELEVEEALVFADRDVVALCSLAREVGLPVVFTSETYLSAAQVTRLLRASGLTVEEATVFTSSDHGCGKANGLFEIAVAHLGVTPEQVLHIGDHEAADVDAARAHGLQAMHRPLRSARFDDLLRREQQAREGVGADLAFDAERGDDGLTALRARFDSGDAPAGVEPSVAEHWVVGASVLGPVFAGFADWLIDRASARGSRRLCCLMREGNLLAPMVSAAASARGAAVEATQLWLSRHVCARAAIVDCDYAELRIFVDRAVPPTIAELARSLDVEVAAFGDLAGRAGSRLDDVALREDVLGRICGDEALRERIRTSAESLRSRVVDAVERAGHTDDDGITLVDLGWHGTTQRMLVRALRAAGSSLPVAGLYLMTTERIVDGVLDGVDADAYLVRAGRPPKSCTTIVRSPEVLEQLCMGAEGSVVDLDDTGAPVLAPNTVPPRQLDEARATRQGIEEFATRWRDLAPTAEVLLGRATTANLRSVLTRFVGDPTTLEAQLYGGWVHDDNFGMATVRQLAHSDLFADGAYVDEARINEVDAIWPGAIVARDARSIEDEPRSLVAMYVDDGTGYSESRAVHRTLTTNGRGLSYIQLGVSTGAAQRIRLDPMSSPAIVRLDRIALKLGLRDRSDPVVMVFPSGRELGEWRTYDCFWLTDTILVGTSFDPSIVLDLDPVLAGQVTSVLASIACTRVDLPDSALADEGELTARRDRAVAPGVRASTRELLAAMGHLRDAVTMRLERERDARR